MKNDTLALGQLNVNWFTIQWGVPIKSSKEEEFWPEVLQLILQIIQYQIMLHWTVGYLYTRNLYTVLAGAKYENEKQGLF